MKSRLTLNEIIRRAILKHGNRYDYSKAVYIDYHAKMTIICSIHGEFQQNPADHLGGHGCPSCGNEKIKLDRTSNLDDFILKARIIHGDKCGYFNVKYINSRTKVSIVCLVDDSHGEFWMTPNSHLNGRGCVKCYYKRLSTRCLSNINDFIEKAFKIHKDKFDYSLFVYVNKKTKGKIICRKHGVFEQTPDSHLQGQGCPICKESKGESLIRDILIKNNINFEREYKIPNSQYKFRYDFYLPDFNLLIEFHGIQHFEVRDVFGGKEAFKETLKNDMFKHALSRMINIRIVYLTYRELKLSREDFEKLLLTYIGLGTCMI